MSKRKTSIRWMEARLRRLVSPCNYPPREPTRLQLDRAAELRIMIAAAKQKAREATCRA